VTLAVDLVFIAQVLVLAAILVWRRAQVGVGLAIWLGVLAVLAGQGYFLDFESMPPRLALAGLLPLVVGLLMLPTHGTRHFLAVTPQSGSSICSPFASSWRSSSGRSPSRAARRSSSPSKGATSTS